ncbi:3-oxoacyl-ACP synthase [Krasilnikovia sp. M28-CT-15]|uniref:3-oxoacyl-ACP synthase n=1 Tax=Krasilnikovia sp. M28-CT-15 TaxID=3373540 RepID=UPI0038773B05
MRLGAGIGIRAAHAWLPGSAETIDRAVAEGRLTADAAAESGVTALPVSADVAAPDMAVRAAEAALADAGVAASRLTLGVHAWIHHQGHDFWSPAHYVVRGLGATRAEAIGVQTMCNGGATGLGIGAGRLLADPGTDLVLVTTADRFDAASFDRWSADYGVYYGDGATAMVLGRRDDASDVLTLAALSTSTLADAEELHRGDDEFSDAPRQHSGRIDVKRTKKAYLERLGADGFHQQAHDALRHIVTTALHDAGLTANDPRIRWLLLPRVGARTRRETYLPAVGSLTRAEILDLGRATGHLGAGDLAANCAGLVSGGLLARGEAALVISAGAGFSFSCAVVTAPTAAGSGARP